MPRLINIQSRAFIDNHTTGLTIALTVTNAAAGVALTAYGYWFGALNILGAAVLATVYLTEPQP